MSLQSVQRAAHRAQELVWSSGVCVGAIACFLFPFSTACVKLLHGHIPILEICLVRSALAWTCSIAAGAATRVRPLWGRRRNAGYLVARGVCGTCAVASNYTAVSLLPLGDAAGLNMLKPCVVAFVGWALLGEPLGLPGAAGLGVSLAGVLVLVHPPFLFGGHEGWGRARMLGTATALASSAFAAGVAFSIRRIGNSEAALTVALAFHSCTLVLSAPPLALSWPQPAVLPSGREAGLLVAIALTSFAAQLLLTRSFQLLPAAQASALSFTSVIYGHILGFVIFKERLTLTSAFGSLVILGGVLLTTTSRPGKAGPQTQHGAAAAAAGSKAAGPQASPVGGSGGGGGGAGGGAADQEAAAELGQQGARGGRGADSDAPGSEDGAEDEGAPLLLGREAPQQHAHEGQRRPRPYVSGSSAGGQHPLQQQQRELELGVK